MSDFVQTMKDWRRMCNTIQSKNQKASIGNWCKGCSLQDFCIIDTSIKDTTNGEFDIIGEQIQAWAAEHTEPVYPTWGEWLSTKYGYDLREIMYEPIKADIAEKLGLEPKEG